MNTQIDTMMDDPIEISLAEQSLALAKQRQQWNAIKDFYRPIINALQRLGIDVRLTNAIDVTFAGDAHKLASVVRILRTSGFSTEAAKPKQGDTSWYAYYTHPDCGVMVWLYFTSSVCRRVKVGTKMVEQDVFETQCGDISIDEPPALTIVPTPELVEELQF